LCLSLWLFRLQKIGVKPEQFQAPSACKSGPLQPLSRPIASKSSGTITTEIVARVTNG
jgi:hypothetical protein